MANLRQDFALELSIFTLPPRHFSWRFRGNSLTLSHDERLKQTFDLIIATSMTDFATLLGLCPWLQSVPSILYFHENQFAYPDGKPERQVERQMTSIYSALAADRLVFNSEFNRRTFLAGVSQLLKKMPDGVPNNIEEQLEDKSQIISVPIDPALSPTRKSDVLSIVWNHRWEHDKGLAELHDIAAQLAASGVDYVFHLIGQRFRNVPVEIEQIQQTLGNRLGEFGFMQDKEAYLRLLTNCDVVLSTARHEFQGIAVLEAVAAGCRPVVPDDLAYQEFIPAECRYSTVSEAVAKITAQEISDQVYSIPDGVQPETVAGKWRDLVANLL